MRLSGLVSHRIRRTFMNNGSGVSRGDRNRNARLKKLRAAVPVTNAIIGIDLAERKQMVVVTDHDSKVLARRTFRCKAWDLGAALDWAGERAVKAGFVGVTVACEPTGTGGGSWVSSPTSAGCRSCACSLRSRRGCA